MRTMYDVIIIGISEIWTKSEKVRKLLIRRLVNNIKKRIPDARVEIRRGRLIVRPYKEEYIDTLRKTFGVKYCAPAWVVPTDYEKIKNRLFELAKDKSGKFKITVNRVWKEFSLTSIEIGRKLAGEIKSNFEALDPELKSPDFEIFIELHKDVTFIFDKKINAYDGYPVGSEGKALALFSGGIDSPVAAWFAAKRGIAVDLLFLNLAGPVHEALVYKVYEKLREWIPTAKLYVIEAINLIEKIVMNVRSGYRQIVYKVFLYKIAEKVAEKLNIKVLITGESLGQVSTQTLDSLVLLEEFAKIPILRPLIALNKDEIKEYAKEIGTLDVSEKVPEVCMLEKHSTASPRKEILLEELEKVHIDIDELVNSLREAKVQHEEDISYLIPRNIPKDKLHIVDLEKSFIEDDICGKKVLFLCPSGITAYYFAKKYREKGIEAYFLDYKTAKRLGYI